MQNLRCSVHPAQNITNFCTQQECLALLCATCICHHTDMHALNGSLPHYENIQQSYKTAYQTIDTQRAVIEREKKRIISYNQNWEKKKQQIYDKIKMAKKDVLQLVQKTFNEIQHRHMQMINQEQLRIGMSSGDRVMKMLDCYNKQSQKLFGLQKQILEARVPHSLKVLYGEALPFGNNLINQISKDIYLLQSHDARLQYIQPNLINIKQNIINLLSFQVKHPQTIIQPQIVLQNVVRQPLVQLVQARMSESEGPLYQTCSTFYGRPQSAGKTLPGKISYMNNRSQILLQTKPKISVISGRLSDPLGSRLVLKNSKRTNIFPSRPVSQIR